MCARLCLTFVQYSNIIMQQTILPASLAPARERVIPESLADLSHCLFAQKCCFRVIREE